MVPCCVRDAVYIDLKYDDVFVLLFIVVWECGMVMFYCLWVVVLEVFGVTIASSVCV